MDRDNYIHIAGWMATELGLKGNELLVYAIIYGFSQTKGQVFNGSLQYLADWTNSTKQGVLKNLKSLVEKGLIEKKETIFNGVKSCEYYSTKFNGIKQSLIGGIKQSLTGGIKQSLTNNIEIDNIDRDNIDLRKNIKKEKDSLLIEEFDSIWSRYPRHEGKQNALKSYIKARHEGVDMVTIKDAVESYRRMCESERREKRYIKQGSTWFNQRSWEDEYGSTKTLGAGTSCENSDFDKYDTEVPF